MKTVIIASKNPVKIEAVKIAFKKMLPKEQFEFIGESIPSGVGDQPMSDAETLQGATNRANNAQIKFPDANFWVGLEGGLEKINNEMHCFAWMVITSKEKIGKGKTSTFLLPKKISNLVEEGYELGVANDMVFNRENSKQSNGAVGILTGDITTRTTYYIEALIMALIPFKNPNLY